jgi:DNA helicase II / ATP-dependent DNA helicase PcrA
MQTFKQYLKPIYKDLDTTLDFSDMKVENKLQDEEFPHLQKTLQQIGAKVKQFLYYIDKLTEEIERQEQIISSETGDDKAEAVGEMNKLLKLMDHHLTLTNRYLDIINSPYFGRIVFDRFASEKYPARELNTYLGKFAFVDPDTSVPLITDWRAPISNLYYQNSGPEKNLSFIAPVGEQKGDLKLKRQFETSRARIDAIYDSKTGNAAADAFLLKQLESRIGKKLQDIVATIQAQQNEIIREQPGRPAIIQGVAGSGKTTIILHRLAYLFYTFDEDIKPERSLIIAPNSMFLDYISDVLPSLGVSGLAQNTYLNWARDLLGWSNKYYLSHIPDDDSIRTIKGDYKFKLLVEKFFEFFEVDLFTSMPDFINFEVQERYSEMRREQPNMSILETINLSIEFAFAQRQFKRKFAGNYMGQIADQQERIKKIKDYVTKRTNPYNMYKEMFKNPRLFEEAGYSKLETRQIIEYTNRTFKGNGAGYPYKIEDLPGMVWFYIVLQGAKNYQKDFIVVDEAQDLSIFQLLTIYKVAKNGNITIAGDTAQSIIPPFYIRDWEVLIDALGQEINSARKPSDKVDESEIVAKDLVAYHQLFRCYRSTVEIIDYANRIFQKRFPKGYRLPEAVLRHGDNVEEIVLKDEFESATEKEMADMMKILNKQFELEAVTVALICRDESHADSVYAKLVSAEANDKLERTVHLYKEDDYKDGVLVLPVSRAKGLEFDSVFVIDVDEKHYPSEELSVRLLYVAITRALHRLFIVSSSQKSKLLS